MLRKTCVLLCIFILLTLPAPGELAKIKPHMTASQNFALVNGQWFNGKSFEARTVYSVNGRFTSKKPARVDRTLDLAGTWIVPPFAEAHNHNLNGIEERDRKAIQKYLADGVFYVKIPGNFLVSDELKQRLGLNRPDSIDAVLAQGASLTATGRYQYRFAEEVWIRYGYFKGPKEALNSYRFFTIDSEADLEQKWPQILSQRPDFIKTTLSFSDEFEQRKGEQAERDRTGLDPRLLPKIVAKAHAGKLRVSTHVNNAADFHYAVAAGVDELAHLPPLPDRFREDEPKSFHPISVADARLAAKRGIVVVTTASILLNLPEVRRRQFQQLQMASLKLLHEHGVALAVGSDNPNDSSVKEFEYLQKLGVFDNLTLLKMWTETTARTIFPQRKIGTLSEGYEASFLALEGNPLEDLQNVRKIKLRFKQGVLLAP